MKINHKIIRDILKWVTFALFLMSVVIKLKAIITHGGTTPIKDPNEDIHLDEDGPVVVGNDDDDDDDDDDESNIEYAENN